MISGIAYYLILGKPVIVYVGILTYIFLLFTATIGYLNFKGKTNISFKWHPRIAVATIILATVHAVFGLSVYLGF